jgi:hypothetical protein
MPPSGDCDGAVYPCWANASEVGETEYPRASRSSSPPRRPTWLHRAPGRLRPTRESRLGHLLMVMDGTATRETSVTVIWKSW